MNAKQAAAVWKAVRDLHFEGVARFIPRGALAGEHVVEIEPGHAIDTEGFRSLLALAEARGLQLSYGLAPRRTVTLS